MRPDIAVRTEGEVVVVAPAGELDAVTSPGLAAVLDELLGAAEPCRGVVIDFSGVDFCDSRCIGVLVAGYRQARDRGIGLAVAAPQRTVHRLFTIAGIDQVMTIEDDVQRAMKLVLV
ncbi:STAS domain-containing protein [Marinitenerispora sediminis]|uniref:Anti-sigma factor antagonist n=1 Tax=Marinitenerispora sediminis TaxID=1931232 RepID=A0A368T3I4_9ACTN|nr:STAS domain-containing protein [Marinitenerispora sediminis]RCV49625.1 anti-anti-sigma factor [Marinitenerispora sediminis]RCV53125.1 anti-anti-sigma factor [Marinitenerispora sediminis]RCV57169.1 anti-anti-sigma factor [Marinitenerispora sediminis]